MAEYNSNTEKAIEILTNGESGMYWETGSKILRAIHQMQKATEDDSENKTDEKRINLLTQLVLATEHEYTAKEEEKAEKAMEESHEGLQDLKGILLSQLRMAIMTQKAPKPLLLVGEPGSGKTSLAVSFAKALGHGYATIQMSGLAGAFVLNGTDASYKNAEIGRITKAFINTSSRNPVIIFDEVDKIGTNMNYGSASYAMLDALECDRARFFVDEFITVPFDASKAWYLLTANTLEGIPEPVLDRCQIYVMPPYTPQEKKKIAKRIFTAMNEEIAPRHLWTTGKQLEIITRKYMTDCGVRGIKKSIELCFSSSSKALLKENNVHLDDKAIERTLQDNIHRPSFPFSGNPGTVPIAAVTGPERNIGIVFPVESSIIEDSYHNTVITGLPSGLMSESAEVARAAAEETLGKDLGLVRINYPFAIRKDGDSAGLATALSIISKATGRRIRKDIAVTGAITMSGLVLQVSGCPVKAEGAMLSGMNGLIIPASSEKELTPFLSSFRNLQIYPVSTLSEAMKIIMIEEEKERNC